MCLSNGEVKNTKLMNDKEYPMVLIETPAKKKQKSDSQEIMNPSTTIAEEEEEKKGARILSKLSPPVELLPY